VCENNKKRREKIAKEGYNKRVKNKTFIFTNLDDDELEDSIIDHQGIMGKSVTKKTEAVISGNVMLFSSKMEKAIELGIKIYTREEFIERYGINV
ncbi:unnamed protein product, partial [marine sediment metagenome]